MLSKVKDLMDAGENIDAVSKKVSALNAEICSQSKDIAAFKKEIFALRTEFENNFRRSESFCSSLENKSGMFDSALDDLKNEVYDFKLIKADIKSRLVSEIVEDCRRELKESIKHLDTDVVRFNELKDELSVLVSKFRSVEGEIEKFKVIAAQVKSADYDLSRYAKELERADSEKLRLLQRIDQLEHLVSKIRRGNH